MNLGTTGVAPPNGAPSSTSRHRRPAGLAMGAGPARGRIGGRYELGHDGRCTAERRLVEHVQILAHGMTRIVGRLPLVTRRRVLPIGVGLYHRSIDGEALAADQTLGNAACHRLLEQLA